MILLIKKAILCERSQDADHISEVLTPLDTGLLSPVVMATLDSLCGKACSFHCSCTSEAADS
jgi:hypothetical protein